MSKQNKRPIKLSFDYLKYDIPAGMVVFLVALPLCLGIAIASGVPPFSGLIAGIIGGAIVALLSNSHTGVSGPAAGLVVIVLSAIAELGDLESFFLAVMIAGGIQVLMGIFRAGMIGSLFPGNVIKGMLAAIGLILIIKEIPHALGYEKDYFGSLDFIRLDGKNTFSALGAAVKEIQPAALIISILSMPILLFYDRVKPAFQSLFPGPLAVVLLGILINELILPLLMPEWKLGADNLVQLPKWSPSDGFAALITQPDFEQINNPLVYQFAVTIAIVASLETLLNVEAVDKLDPYKRRTNANRELIAQGFGNGLSGFLGGLPITAVIVRGAANISAGAKTKFSAFLHGILLFLSFVAIPDILNKIPFASLAIILMLIGYKLTRLSLYRDMFRAGKDQFIPFLATVLAIMLTDLLIGVTVGMAVAIFFILQVSMRNTYVLEEQNDEEGKKLILILSDEVTFLNKTNIRTLLDGVPNGSRIVIDVTRSVYIHFDIVEVIRDFIQNAPGREIKAELIGLKDDYQALIGYSRMRR